MFGVYYLPTTVQITYYPKTVSQKTKKQPKTFQTPSFALCEKLSNFSFFFFPTYHFQKYFKKPFFCLLKAFYYLLLFVVTYIDLSCPKVFYKRVLLSSNNVAMCNLRSLIIPKAYSKCVLLC